MRRARVSNVAAGLILIALGYCAGQSSRYAPVQIVTVYDTLAAADYHNRVNALRIEADGWRARLEAVESRAPERVIVVDSIVTPPDTVLRFVSIRDGRVSSEVLISIDTLASDARRPELRTGTDVSDCDDGLMVSADGVICDRARFGHLSLFADVATNGGMLGLEWTPTYRSGWNVYLGYSDRGISAAIRKGWRLF